MRDPIFTLIYVAMLCLYRSSKLDEAEGVSQSQQWELNQSGFFRTRCTRIFSTELIQSEQLQEIVGGKSSVAETRKIAKTTVLSIPKEFDKFNLGEWKQEVPNNAEVQNQSQKPENQNPVIQKSSDGYTVNQEPSGKFSASEQPVSQRKASEPMSQRKASEPIKYYYTEKRKNFQTYGGMFKNNTV